MGKLFQQLRPLEFVEQEEYLRGFEEKNYNSLSHIIKSKGADTDIYYLYEGEAILYIVNFNSEYKKKFVFIALVKAGESFNESEILYGKPYQYGLLTISKQSTILSLTKEKFMKVTDIDSENNLRVEYLTKDRFYKTKLKKLKRMTIEELINHQ